MTKRIGWWFLLTATIVPVVFAAAPAASDGWPWWGWEWDDEDEDEEEFDQAEIFLELNDTDGDLGIQALIDGEPWKKLEIEDPSEREILNLRTKGRLRRQGLTELSFESQELTFDELSPEEFLDRFPSGIYEIEARTLEGTELENEAFLSHVLPAGAEGFTVDGFPARPLDGSDCDENEAIEISGDVVVEFDAVTTSHPTIGETDPDIEIVLYQVVGEFEDEDENDIVSITDLKPVEGLARYSLTIDEAFFREGEVKFEVLAREATFNLTAVESCPFEYVPAP